MNETFMKEKPVFSLLVSMAFPMVISMLVNSLYNIVDSYFVAKISEDAMTALSLVFPVQNFINAAGIGFGVGMNAVISFYLGAKDYEKADMATTQGLLLSAVHGVLLTIVSIEIMPFFLRLFTGSEAVAALGIQYSDIAFSFALVVSLSMAFEKIFQAVGRMKVTMISLLIGCCTNIALDPVLIFGLGFFPKMGIRGAALATGIGQVLTLCVYFVICKIRPLSVHVRRSYLRPDKHMVGKLYAIGIPATLNMALSSVLISALNAILAVYSEAYILVLGIYYKLQTFLYLPANGIIQGIFELVLVMNGLIMLGGTVICMTIPATLMGLFTHTPETIRVGETALRLISAGFLTSAISVTASGALEGLGKGMQSLVISLCRYIVIIIPAAMLLSYAIGATGVWHAFWIAEGLTAIISMLVFRHCKAY